jgi:hypothetical protein
MKFHEFYKKHIYPFFDGLEDRTRAWLSRRPKLYAFVAGFGIVLFWRAIWHLADIIEAGGGTWGFLFTPQVTLVTSTILLLISGLFVSFFVGDVIIMSGLRKEKKFVDHAQEEIDKEQGEIHHMEKVLDRIEQEVEHLHTGHSTASTKPSEKFTEHRSGGGVQPKG